MPIELSSASIDIQALMGLLVTSSQSKSSQLYLPPLTDSAKTTITGTEIDDKFATQIFGKDIPVFVGGQALMGCRIIEGPFIYTESAANLVDMIVSPAIAATPTATRTITYLNLNGTQSATSSDGGTTWSPIGTSFAGLEISVKTGTETQTPFASSISRYGSRAVAYRSHICVEIKKIPLSVFNNIIPFVSIFVHEADSITRNDALAALAQYARYDATEYEFDVVGSDTFWVVAQQTTFIEYLQQFQKIFGNWNITLSDKLRVFENNSSTVDAVLSRSNCMAGTLKLVRRDPLSVPRQRSYSFIDTGRDNDINTITATLERFPVPVTSSQDAETIELPIGTIASLASADVNRSLLIDDIARTLLSPTVLTSKYGIEPGDIVSFDDDPSISFLGRVTSVARKTADKTADIQCEKIDFFTLNIRPRITSNGGGATASITINEGDTVVTTVTATDVNSDALTFSIGGGADATLFTIDATTGVLAFLVAPNYETPTDADSNGIYEVTVQVSDGSLTDMQAISVTVAFVSGVAPATPIGLLLSLTRQV